MVSTILIALVAILAVLLLVVFVLGGWVSTLLGLPGNWIIVAAAVVYGLSIPDTWRIDIGTRWIIALVVLAAVGEVLEFVAGAVGAQRAGGSREAAIYALLGSMIGGIVGAFVGIPIPVIGPLVGVLVMGGVGAAVGAYVAESNRGTESGATWRISWGAFWGRLLGTGVKSLVGCVMVVVVVIALFVPNRAASEPIKELGPVSVLMDLPPSESMKPC